MSVFELSSFTHSMMISLKGLFFSGFSQHFCHCHVQLHHNVVFFLISMRISFLFITESTTNFSSQQPNQQQVMHQNLCYFFLHQTLLIHLQLPMDSWIVGQHGLQFGEYPEWDFHRFFTKPKSFVSKAVSIPEANTNVSIVAEEGVMY